MALQKGEKYRCQHEGCGCEIEVTRGPQGDDAGEQNPTCCCGSTMQKVG